MYCFRFLPHPEIRQKQGSSSVLDKFGLRFLGKRFFACKQMSFPQKHCLKKKASLFPKLKFSRAFQTFQIQRERVKKKWKSPVFDGWFLQLTSLFKIKNEFFLPLIIQILMLFQAKIWLLAQAPWVKKPLPWEPAPALADLSHGLNPQGLLPARRTMWKQRLPKGAGKGRL